MGHIRKEELHESLINELEELGNIDLSGKQDKTDESLLTESKDLVGAINELFQSANNGKELIASAIGEPLYSNDTFSAMSDDINGLLSTFKTNMMNNGVTVESGDKFKQLIDKIATMVEEGSGKGIQFASGELNLTINDNYIVNTNLGFTPNFIFITDCTFTFSQNENGAYPLSYTGLDFSNVAISTFQPVPANPVTISTVSIDDVTDNNFKINMILGERLFHCSLYITSWYAIGVGEEDTTLRDSLASILQEEGVSVTEEDDMASLISKVSGEFTKDNNQINSLTNELAGKVTPAGTAVASNVLTGKTFINSTGQTITGTMANKGTKTFTPKATEQSADAGYYTKVSCKGDANLVAANIVSGKSIFGVTGTATAIKVSAGSRFTFYSNSTRTTAPSNANYNGSTSHRYTLEFDGTYNVSASTYTSYNSVTLYVKIVLADSSGNIIQEFGETSRKLGSSNGGLLSTSATVTGKAGQIIILYGKCHYSSNTTKSGNLSFNSLDVTGEITKA